MSPDRKAVCMSEKIMMDSPEAATYRTDVKGWVSSRGVFYGEQEDLARYDGSTHRICKACGTEHPTRAYCDTCSDRKRQERWEALEVREWDGIAPLAIYEDDRYFFDVEDLEQHCEEFETTPDQLRLVFCQPVFGPLLDKSFFEDCLPEDTPPPDSIYEAMEYFNAVVKAAGPLSWFPGKVRAIVQDFDAYYTPAAKDPE